MSIKVAKDAMAKIEEQVVGLLAFNYYKKHLKSMIFTLKLSRFKFLKYNPTYLLFIQRIMSASLDRFQKVIREGRDLLKNETDKYKKKLIVQRINAHYQLARILQTIADGIAWRNLKCNRPLMRLLSDNDGPGFIDKQIHLIMGITAKSVLIVNDLTRFCRIGDFTNILPDGRVIIYEAKKGDELKNMGDILDTVKKHSNPKLSSQQRRHIIAQNAFIKQKIEVPIFKDGKVINDLEVEIINVPIKIKTYYKKFIKLLKKAKRFSYAYSEFENGYFILIKDYDSLLNNLGRSEQIIDEIENQYNKVAPDWVKMSSPNKIIFDSYFSFTQKHGQFARNILPYSLLPLCARDCIRMMSGQLRVRVWYDLNYLKNCLIVNGWSVTETRLKENIENGTTITHDRPERDLFKKEHNDHVFVIEKRMEGGVYKTFVSLTEILQMVSSFYSTDFLIDSLEYRRGLMEIRREKATLAFNYPDEQKILV